MADLEHVLTGRGAFDKRDPDPKKNYGIGAVQLVFVTKGKAGATSFSLMTGWLPKELVSSGDKALEELGYSEGLMRYQQESNYSGLMPYDLGYHSLEPRHDLHLESGPRDCAFVEGDGCYYDGSSLNAWPVFEVMLRDGPDGVWLELDRYYEQVFGDSQHEPPMTFGESIIGMSNILATQVVEEDERRQVAAREEGAEVGKDVPPDTP